MPGQRLGEPRTLKGSMDLVRASGWLVILAAIGCGKQFDSSEPDSGVEASAGSAIDRPDAASSGRGGSGGHGDASSPMADAAPESGDTGGSERDARADNNLAEDVLSPETSVPRDVIDVVVPEVGLVPEANVQPLETGVDSGGGRDAAIDHLRGCPSNLPGPALVEVPAPNGSTYCIDSTEVTNGQYAAFLAAKGNDSSGQDAWCSWNTSYVPNDGWPTARDDFPVISVDWCDAFAYCHWAGKSLCGKIGGGPNLPADTAYAPLDAWYNACSQGGTRTYPYGNGYEPATCNGADNFADPDTAGATAVGAKAACAGGYNGLVDMSGNLAEWEDSCTDSAGPDDICRLRGGAFINSDSDLRCDMIGSTYRNYWYHFAGIRCCASSL